MESFKLDSPWLCAGEELRPVLPPILPLLLPEEICLPFEYSVPGLADGPMPKSCIVAGVPIQYFKSKEEEKTPNWVSLITQTEKWGPAGNNDRQAGLDNQNYTQDA